MAGSTNLRNDNELSVKDQLKSKLLVRCVQNEDYSMCKELLESWHGGINYCPEDGAGAIHLAAGISDEILSLLLVNNADPNLRSSEGSVALHVAATYGRAESIKLLLSYGADPNITDEENASPLDRARENGCRMSIILLEQAVMGLLNSSSDSDEDQLCFRKGPGTPQDKLSPDEYDPRKHYIDVTSPDHPHIMFRDSAEQTVVQDKTCVQVNEIAETSSTTTDSYHTCSDPPSPETMANTGNNTFNEIAPLPNRDCCCHENRSTYQKHTVNISHRSVGSMDSFPTLVEMDTPSCLNNLSSLTDFVPDNMLEQLERLNISANSVASNLQGKNVKEEAKNTSDLISDDETILYETKAERYSELMISPKYQVSKSQSVDSGFTSDSRSPHNSRTGFAPGNNRYSPPHALAANASVSTLASDTTWLSGPLTSSVVGHRKAVLPNISLTSISSQGSDDVHSSSPITPTMCCCRPVCVEVHKDETGKDFVVEVTLPKDGCESCTEASVWSESDGDGTVLYDWKDTMSPEALQVPNQIRQMTNGELLAALVAAGLSQPGPITMTTRKAYEIRLVKLREDPSLADKHMGVKYSPELEDVLNDRLNTTHLTELETSMVKPFSDPDPARIWREGTQKSSFNYLLLDPRITRNLPKQAKVIGEAAAFKIFVSAVFYIGKGKKSRSFAHFKEAMKDDKQSEKVKQIRAIWKEGLGVVTLHVFQNTIPTEAYTREACMILALGLDRLTNKQPGQCYGPATSWPPSKKRRLGVLLLYKAFRILLIDGERQIKLMDLK